MVLRVFSNASASVTLPSVNKLPSPDTSHSTSNSRMSPSDDGLVIAALQYGDKRATFTA